MLKRLVMTCCALLFSSSLLAAEAPAAPQQPHVLLTTNHGEIEIELYADRAPISVKNFLQYVDDGFYNGLIFHRVIPGFMIQGGGFTPDMQQKQPGAPIRNEASNGLHNTRGTLAMARTSDINSATSQFFINLKTNDFLDNGARDFGYAVFGRVVRGMDIVDHIAFVPTGRHGMHGDVPVQPVIIQSASRL